MQGRKKKTNQANENKSDWAQVYTGKTQIRSIETNRALERERVTGEKRMERVTERCLVLQMEGEREGLQKESSGSGERKKREKGERSLDRIRMGRWQPQFRPIEEAAKSACITGKLGTGEEEEHNAFQLCAQVVEDTKAHFWKGGWFIAKSTFHLLIITIRIPWLFSIHST